mgnify:FL=1
MDIGEIRTLTDQQLLEEIEKTQKELMNLRFRAATNQLPDTNVPKTVRRSLARLKTVIRERQLIEG